MTNKIYLTCKKSVTINRFSNDDRRRDGKKSTCMDCANISCKARYIRSIKRPRMRYHLGIDNIIDGKKLCSCCENHKLPDCFCKDDRNKSKLHVYCNNCRRLMNQVDNIILRMEFALAYGGRCECCGETGLSLLTIEHVTNKGHSLIYGNPLVLMRKLKKMNWPVGYKCLCFNCNLSTSGGRPCFHDTKNYKDYIKTIELFLGKLAEIKSKKYSDLRDRLNKIAGKYDHVE